MCLLGESRSWMLLLSLFLWGFSVHPSSFSGAPAEWRRQADASVCAAAPPFKLGRAVAEFVRATQAHAGGCFLEVNPLSLSGFSGALCLEISQKSDASQSIQQMAF